MSAQRSVLVVDDDEQLLRLMIRLLGRAGHRVQTARSLAETLALFDPREEPREEPREHEPREEPSEGRAPDIDLVLLDVNLAPGSGAAELLPLLHARAPGLEVVLMSGDALPEPLESELSRRGGRFLRKPFDPKSFLRWIAEPVGRPPGDGDAGDAGDAPTGTGH